MDGGAVGAVSGGDSLVCVRTSVTWNKVSRLVASGFLETLGRQNEGGPTPQPPRTPLPFEGCADFPPLTQSWLFSPALELRSAELAWPEAQDKHLRYVRTRGFRCQWPMHGVHIRSR